MKILLDTHAFLWAVSDDPRLSKRARAVLDEEKNQLLLSAASGWEIAIKAGLGKIRLADEPALFVPRHLRALRADALPVSMDHALASFALPQLHRDPFDRLLVAQARSEGVTILTGDPQIARYGVEVVW